MALYNLRCADVLLRNHSLTHCCHWAVWWCVSSSFVEHCSNRLAARQPLVAPKQFSVHHKRRGNLKPETWAVGSAIG